MNVQNIPPPEQLPFLRAICWQMADVRRLTAEEALARYERGWRYVGVLGELGAEERVWLRHLARCFGSWIRV